MLNKLDDYLVHQTPEPLAQAATSDRNVYDRTWFNGYAKDSSYYFGLGMAIYPHRDVLDAAFSMVRPGGLQHCFYGSRRAPSERTDMSVGPMRIEVVEPMLTSRVILEENDSGLACDLTFTGRSACIQEQRQTLWSGAQRIMDATRFDQFGRWEGVLHTPEGDILVDPEVCHATKDRSWGVRGVGEPITNGAPQPHGSFFFLWVPLFWDDHITHAIFFDDKTGHPLIREGLTAPLYPTSSAVPGVEDGLVQRMATAAHRVEYHSGTRLAKYAEIDLIDTRGKTRTITLEPTLRFQFKGLGYGHPKWRQGAWHGELETGFESFDPNELDLLRPENVHVQQIVKATDGKREGLGVLEQIVVGPYEPAGFTSWTDGAG
jgi:hypothetical protein